MARVDSLARETRAAEQGYEAVETRETWRLAWCTIGAIEANLPQSATVEVSNCQQKGDSDNRLRDLDLGVVRCGLLLIDVEVNC
jgi:hypothetical protein